MHGFRCAAALMALLLLAPVAAGAQTAPAPSTGHAPTLLTAAVPAPTGARLIVSSPAFADGGDLPIDNTQYGANRFPGLTWSAGPAGTRSYVVVLQGQGGKATSIHLTLFNIPAGATSLAPGLTDPPSGAIYGVNVHGANQPYVGPHTHGAAKVAYPFQVFALDRMLPADPNLSFEALTEAMRGHVLASGALTAMSARPPGAGEETARSPLRIETGLLAGAAGRDPAITVYKGVPYAAAPVGPLRFRPPAAPAAWEGVRQADRFGALCPQPQGGGPPPAGPMDEDCLTANVWTAAAAGEKRPVLVWIYGGGFLTGTGASPEFDGEGLARKGVVVVTFNYRLGALGFLATPALSAEAEHGASGNYGLLDDIALLKWVRRNIAAFGGDPDQVTIAGQSAGAGSVGFLSMSPLAKGLFKRAIAQSHSRYPRDPDLRFLSVSYRTRPAAEQAGQAYAQAHGATTVEALRAMPWRDLIEGSDAVEVAVETGSTGKPPLFRPVLDGWVIPSTYGAALAKGAFNDVVVVTGNNRDETGAVPVTAFAALRARSGPPRAGTPQVNVTLAAYVQAARAKYGAMADAFLRLYPASTDDEAALASNAAAYDNNRVSTYLWAAERAKGTSRPIFTYWWTHAPPGAGHDLRGAYHGSEINYVLGNLDANDRPWTAEDRAIAERMSSYWANIIKTGDPNGEGLPTWAPFDAKAGSVMVLGDQWGATPVAASAAKLDFWRRFYATQAAW
ncbi:carboxylesterase [Caulobacter sp. D5]|nr:carboxylesterase [Caulobacter sp. D5]